MRHTTARSRRGQFQCRAKYHRRSEGRTPLPMRAYDGWCDDCAAVVLARYLERIARDDVYLAAYLDRLGYVASPVWSYLAEVRAAIARRRATSQPSSDDDGALHKSHQISPIVHLNKKLTIFYSLQDKGLWKKCENPRRTYVVL